MNAVPANPAGRHFMKTLLVILCSMALLTTTSHLMVTYSDEKPPPARQFSETPPVVMKADLPPRGDKPRYSPSGYDITPLSEERIEELAADLDPEALRVLIKCGTEQAGTGSLLNNKKSGVYACKLCGLPLFKSEHKYDSGTGWPSYVTPYDPMHVLGVPDSSFGMKRTEVVCARSGAHLGHVFEDGPPPGGLRFCINSAALTFYEEGEELPPETQPLETETAYFAGGCFWGIEHYFGRGPGVVKAVSGYMQGELEDPTYRQVVRGDTGHAETVKVVFDPRHMTYRRLLEAFFVMHDPTQLNRQGPDTGEHYRSGIWYVNDEQREQAEAFIEELGESDRYDQPIVTQVQEAETFWRAEEYHQNYIERTGRACHVTNPW